MKLIRALIGCLVMSSIITSFALGSEGKEGKPDSRLAVAKPASSDKLKEGYVLASVSKIRNNRLALLEVIAMQQKKADSLPADDQDLSGFARGYRGGLKMNKETLKIFDEPLQQSDDTKVLVQAFPELLFLYEEQSRLMKKAVV